jgi:hypothetical protein
MKILNNTIECNLSSVWGVLSDIRAAVEEVIKTIEPAEIDFAKMAASELCENAIKYGIPAASSNMKFILTYYDHIITIAVTNAISDEMHEKNLRSYLQLLNSDNMQDLYMKRLYALMDNKNPQVSQLGLIRIACICGYKLSCEYNDGLVKVTATKKIKD